MLAGFSVAVRYLISGCLTGGSSQSLFSGRFEVMLILVFAVGFGCGLNYREVRPFWLPLTVWMGYCFTGSEVLLFVRWLPAISVTVLYRRSVGGRFPAATAMRCVLF